MVKIELSKKENTVLKLSTDVLKLEVSKGHLRWKVTELEAKTKISRSLIYKYLGSTKPEMLKNALHNFTNEFYGFREDGVSLPFHQRIGHTRQYLIDNYEVILFYQKWRIRESWIQNEFRAVEKKFQSLLKETFPDLSAAEILAIHSFIHGLVSAPFLTTAQASDCALSLEKTYGLKK